MSCHHPGSISLTLWGLIKGLVGYINKVITKMVYHHCISFSHSSQSSIVRRCLKQPPIKEITSAPWSVPLHSYKDYRSNEDYSLTPQFWLILAVRFAFVIVFEVSHLAHRQSKQRLLAPPQNPSLSYLKLNRSDLSLKMSNQWAIWKIWVLSLMKAYFHRQKERLHS